MPPEVAVVEVTRTRTVVVEVPGPSYSDARVLAYLRTVLNTNGDLLTVASNTLARIAVGAAPAGSVPIWSGSSWSVGTMTVAVAWNDVTGKPSTFPPSTHSHTPADVTGFNAAAVDAVEEVGNGVLVTTGGTAAAVAGATTNHALLWNGTTWGAGAVPYSALSGVPSTFAPSSHTHTASEITDFNTAWTARLTALGSGASTGDALLWNGSAWAAGAQSGGGMTNPMTTAWDIIRGGSSGAATRLALGPPQTTPVSSGGTLSYELVRPVAMYSAVNLAIGEWSSITLRGTTSGGTTADVYGVFRQRSGANVVTGLELVGNVPTDLNRAIEVMFMIDTALPGASVGTIWVGAGGVGTTTQLGQYRAQIQWSGSGNYVTRFADASSASTPVDLGFAPTLNQLVRVVIRMRRTYVAIQCYDGVTGAALSQEVQESTITPIGSGTTVFGAFALLNSGGAGLTSGMRVYTGQTRVLG